MSKRMYHPCHKLSVPSAKLFWCRHCMQMFEDAISRWKHSRKCHAIPGYKQKDKDARVVQLYVKPDNVCYTSNITPGQVVYHKPHVKKTSAALKCVICGTKFSSLYDMRRHVKEPCQKSESSELCKQIQLNDTEDDIESYSILKIRRVETEEEEKLNTNTALSVLAEASKHVESLSHSVDVKLEQVIEENPQVIEHISQSAGNSSGQDLTFSFPLYQSAESSTINISQHPVQEVVVAYPRPQVKPELGTVVISLQSEDGKQILPDSVDLETIQECVKDTALTLPVGQIIHIHLESQETYLEFVVGYQGIIWPVEEKCTISSTNSQEQTTNAVLSRKVQTAPPDTRTGKQEPLPNSSTENTKVDSCSDIIELINQPILDSHTIYSQEVVVTSEEQVSQGDIPQYNKQKVFSLLKATDSGKQVQKEQFVETIPVQLENISVDHNLPQSIYQVSLLPAEQQQGSSNIERIQFGEQVCMPVAGGQTSDLGGIQTITKANTESLVEALLKGKVTVSSPAQEQTEIAVVQVSEQQVQNLVKADLQLLQSYQQNAEWPVENN